MNTAALSTPSAGKWIFRAVTTLAPVGIALLFELQRQIDSGGDLAWRPIASAVIGALLVAYAHLARSGTEHAETVAEIATGIDQDDDNLTEGPPTG